MDKVLKTYKSSPRPGQEGARPQATGASPTSPPPSHWPLLGGQRDVLGACRPACSPRPLGPRGGRMPTGRPPDDDAGPSLHGSPPSLPAQLPPGWLPLKLVLLKAQPTGSDVTPSHCYVGTAVRRVRSPAKPRPGGHGTGAAPQELRHGEPHSHLETHM